MKYMEHGETIVEETRQADLKKSRVIYAGLGVAVIFLFLLSLCFKTSTPGFISPKETFIDLFTALRLFFSDLFNLPYSMDRSEIIASLPNYHISLTRLARTIMFCLSGMGVALAGAIFQTVYKNPMASPNIIGATVGVQLGNVLMITLYGTMAIYMPLTRYKYCYILTAIIVGGVLLMGKIAGGKRATYSVIEMVMAGSVVSQAFQVVTTYMMYNLEDDDLLTYQQLTMGTDIKTDIVSMSAFCIAMAASLLPMFLIRFRFNGAGFSMDEAKLQGINGVRLRMGGQVCGVIMVTAAMIHCGDVGMISMAVPHLARYLVGADFRRVSVCSMLFGAILMLGCRIVSSMIYIENTELPVNFIISLCIMPVFLVVLTRQRRGFE
ncbi:MAG: iron ABC transporter permease [Clostridiales bacterium]|nr:iron ABC transporter permease [Clostridiales bacterium]